ncbi:MULTISPECIES: glycosyltransferase family 32 protein [unclassified Rhizobium]|uniref:glycosyltransferase family 32 protein n=1 Tax=unclassified Rhizobium TaxID=2613769 RepID=UPI000A8CDDF5|nr:MULTISPECIES: glycosyltransferase [unclassified Rhizobium]
MTDTDNPRARAREIIAQSIEQARAGDPDGARQALDALAADTELVSQAELGPPTVLGLPRKLHSAYLKLAKLSGDRLRVTGLQFTLVPDPGTMEAVGTYTGEQRRLIARLAAAPVPRILHQVWIGDLPQPPAVAAWRAHCAAHGMEYRLWDTMALQREGFHDHPSYADMLAREDYPGAADVARYLVLERFGGIYMDADWYPARDDAGFEDFIALVGFTALAAEIPRLTSAGGLLLANAFIATPAAHPVIQRIIEAMPGIMEALPGAPAWWSTGPLIFTYASRGAGVTLATADMMAAVLPRRAPFSDVQMARETAMRTDRGFIIDWKSW